MRYKIEVLTPVHIGNGNIYKRNLEFIFKNGYVHIIDIEKMIEMFKDNEMALSQIGNPDFNIKNFLEKYKIDIGKVTKYKVKSRGVKLNPNQIEEFIKTGIGTPIIPGSSIKGAIRTAFLSSLVKLKPFDDIEKILKCILDNEKIKKNEADDKIVKKIFGKEPNYDFMRTLQISDCEFKMDDLEIIEIKILDIKQNDSYGWWKKIPGGSVIDDKIEKGTSIFLEGLTIKTGSFFEIKIEEFLFENVGAKEELKFERVESYLKNFHSICKDFSCKWIEEEIKFFSKIKFKELENFYSDLLNKTNDTSSFLLPLGWGIGWKKTTGNFLSDFDYYFSQMRKKFNLGKLGTDIFPKTRKLVLYGNKLFPLGLIKVEKI